MQNNKNAQNLHDLRHSAAHLLAQALCELYPGTLLTLGPVTDDGFFYDFLPPQGTISEADLPAIEEKMRKSCMIFATLPPTYWHRHFANSILAPS